ncbi:glutathione S-transferase [Boletus reticuloceps]|uniref:Glutathione S-transferase n=1 Tax=Boletus reticuloceps TaxID=495285 RepID=A0A8I3A526_9AGAM|nr:glutathione S-transferase [Boletus reticuloceps]
MPEQITYYHDVLKISPFCHRVEIALLEAGASYTPHGFDIFNKPAWFAKVNPFSGKIPALTYGGPHVPPEEPSPLSFKLTESFVILEFLADLFPNASLLPPVSDPTARARVRFFIDAVARHVETPMFNIAKDVPGALEKMMEGLETFQALLPDPEAAGGEYAMGKVFTNADCAIAPILGTLQIAARTDVGRLKAEVAKKVEEMLAETKFDRLRRYQKALWERESVKKVLDLERIEGVWRARFARN